MRWNLQRWSFYMNLFMNINFARNQHDTDRTKLEAQFY